MTFYIRNISGSDVVLNDLGITIPPSENYDLTQDNAVDVAASIDLIDAINAGTIRALDPLDGATQLSQAKSLESVASMNDPHYRIRGGALDQLDDVTISDPQNNHVLSYNGGLWGHQIGISWGSISLPAANTISAPGIASTLTLAQSSGISVVGSDSTITFSPANDLAAIEALTTTGLGVRTATDAWTTRSIAGTTNQISLSNGNGVAGDPTISIATDPILPGSAKVQIPSGTTAQRPGVPNTGDTRFNTTTDWAEIWDGTRWLNFGAINGVVEVKYGQISQASGTTTIPSDNSAPTSSEGTQIFSDTMTTLNSTDKVLLSFSTFISNSVSGSTTTVSVFRGTTLIGVTCVDNPSVTGLFIGISTNNPRPMSFVVVDAPGSAATHTYSIRIGSTSGTWYVARKSDATYGGTASVNNQCVLMRIT